METETIEVELKSVVTEATKRTRFQVNLVDCETPPRMRLDSASSDDNRYKSFRQLTREALPRLDNYRNIMSVHVACRPTLDELHNCDLTEKDTEAHNNEPSRPVKKKHEQGWIKGVLIRNLVQIWGLMLFLRVAWVVCTTGLVSGIVIILFGCAITTITALSMSAISTNGVLKEGGTYFMISRSLGPEFGACIGVIYSIALSAACAMHLVGFCEMLQIILNSFDKSILDGGVQDMRLLGIGLTATLLCATLGGIRSRIQIHAAVLILIVVAIMDVFIGAIYGPKDEDEKKKGFVGMSWYAINHNMFKNYSSFDDWSQSFWCGFSVFFPAVSGFLAGTNKSGELKDSLRAIPRGSLTSIFISSSVYISMAIIVGSTFIDHEYDNPNLMMSCEAPSKLFAVDRTIGLIAFFKPLVYACVLASTLTASFSSFLAAPKVFQMLCNDKLYNNLSWFGLSNKSGEPIRADILTTIIVFMFILPGDLNAILPSISNIFLSVYALINFSTFHASLVKPIGWRPTFKFYNMWLSLGGSMLCVVLMFVISWWTALVTLAAILALYLIVSYQKPDVNWGTSTQAQTYKQALMAVHNLIRVEDHVKNFRPQLLVLTGMTSARPSLIDFAHLITKNLSLLVCGNIIKTPTSQKLLEIYSKRAINWLCYHKIKGFYVQIDGTNFEDGAKSLMQTVGLGKLKPNIIMLGYKNNWFKCSTQDLNMYFNVLHKALDIHMAVCILRVKSGLNFSNSILIDETQLDVMINRKASYLSEEPLLQSRSQSMSTVDKNESEEEHELLTKETSIMMNKLDNDNIDQQNLNKNKKVNIVKGSDGYDLPKDTLLEITRFQRKQKKGNIDVWWLYDDGGLTLLLPYILRTRGNWSSCKLRVFTIANKKDQLDFEQRSIASLLAKFRIDYSDLQVITDLMRKPHEETLAFYNALIKGYKPKGPNSEHEGIKESDLTAMKEKTNRHLRLRELLLENSQEANLVVMTLPMPRKNVVPAALYMSWLETLTQGMPPFLLVRGNQNSVLTFYS